MSTSLDPEDWPAFRASSHAMLDDMLDYIEQIRTRPVWQPIPPELRALFRQPLPREGSSLQAAHEQFMTTVLPHAVGNVHPGFMGWVHGGGTAVGMLAEMLAGGLNANTGGRDQMPLEVERQVVHWMRELFGFPDTASGVFVTGTSMANLMGVLVARCAKVGTQVREHGVEVDSARLVAYTSSAAHGCIARAMDMAGLGSANLRRIAVNARHEMKLADLRTAIAADRTAGLRPFLLIGTAGTVDTGAVDPLAELAAFAREEQLWFHIDGAYGALGMLSPEVARRLAGIELADSIAFDFHKWGQVQYDAGFLLVRDGARHMDAFASPAAYLQREARGLAAGSPWPCDFGPDLSRSFRALKTWFTFQVYGAERIGQAIAHTCALAQKMGAAIAADPALELLAPVGLNIVCFRYRFADGDADARNRALAIALQESGIAVVSTTFVNGVLALRAAIVNHRTMQEDVDALLGEVRRLGALVLQGD